MTINKLNAIVIGSVIGLTALFVMVLVLPGSRKIKSRQEEIVSLTREVQAAQEDVGNISQLYASIQELEQRMAGYRLRLPVERQFGEFLKTLSDQLQRAGIEQNTVQQRPELRLDNARLPEQLKIAAGTGLLPVKIAFDSTFPQLFEFLGSVENLQRLSHVESIEVTTREDEPGRVHAEVVLLTYYRPNGIATPSKGS